MAKIVSALLEKEFYHSALIGALNEDENEGIFVQQARRMFSDCYIIRFKKDVDYNGATCKPDLAIIKKDFSKWFVIEVELANHSIKHIIKQVTIFKNAKYSKHVYSDYILEQLSNVYSQLDKVSTFELIKRLLDNVNPEILVVLNSEYEKLTDLLDKENIKYMLFEVYIDTEDNEVYRIVNDYPINEISSCFASFDSSTTSHILKIRTKTGSMFEAMSEVTIFYKNKPTVWKITRNNGTTVLALQDFVNPVISYKGSPIKIHKTSNDKFYFSL